MSLAEPTLMIFSAIFACVLTYALFVFARLRLRGTLSPLRSLPGPKRDSWFRGNFKHSSEPESTRKMEDWARQYGPIFRYHSFLGTQKLMALDAKAVNYVLSQGAFQKSEVLRHTLGSVLGRGLLFEEGAAHKRQRKVMNPAFGPTQIRKFADIFLEKSIELRDILLAEASSTTRKDGRHRVNIFAWLNKVTLDIIGLTGFNYSFDALHTSDEQPNELYDAVNTTISASARTVLFVLQHFFPLARIIPSSRSRKRDASLKTIRRIGSHLIAEKKAAVLAESSDGVSVAKDSIQGHDLLSLLIRANMASDMAEGMRMSDEEILSQVPTFIMAGHETTSTAVTWTLFALSCNPLVQIKLREELSAYPNDKPSMDELNSLRYLDAVVREALRLYPPVSATQRVAMQDEVIPLSRPIVDKHGVTQHSIRVAAGDVVTVPIRLLNRSTEIWGEDANEFRPERWEDLPVTTNTMPSVWGNLLTFLAGVHACIGFRFSTVEMKALLFTLIRAFEFELAMSPDDIVRKTMIVGRPSIEGNPEAGPQLPVLIRPVKLE
ncbi:cytochrome P450 [Amylostereum chailletii]|nr:cytochrome P450 [Amylostereum chailletii]